MAVQAGGARLGSMGVPVAGMANMAGSIASGGMPAGIKSGIATASANPALAGRTPGFMG
jgi:type VI secretion system secreted protein VgrG